MVVRFRPLSGFYKFLCEKELCACNKISFRPLSGFYKFLFKCLEEKRKVLVIVSVPCRGSISFYPVARIAFIAMLFHWICGGKENTVNP